MIIVKPELVDDDVLTSNIAEPDYSKGEIEWAFNRLNEWSHTQGGSIPIMCHYSERIFLGGGANASKVYTYSIVGADLVVSEFFTLNATTPNIKSIAYNSEDSVVIIMDQSLDLSFYSATGTFIAKVSDSSIGGQVIAYGGGYIYGGRVSSTEKAKYYYSTGYNQSDFSVSGSWEVGSVGDVLFLYGVIDEVLYAKSNNDDIKTYQLFENNNDGQVIGNDSFDLFTSQFEKKLYRQEVIAGGDNLILLNLNTETATGSRSYTAGDTLTYVNTHSIYQCLVTGTLDRPDIGETKEVPTWLKLGATNKYAMFDGSQGELNNFSGIISTQTESDSTVNITLSYPVAINAVCGFNIENCATVEVTISGGTAYNETITLGTKKSFSLFGLSGTTVTLEFTPSTGMMKIGEVVAGQETALGESNFGGSLGLLDFSRVETDSFGNVSVTPRRRVKTIDYDVTLATSELESTFNFLSDITTVPAVYAAESEFTGQALVVFAIYQDFRATVEAPEYSSYTLSVQGLV